MFVLRTSRFTAPVKFTLFAPHIKLAHKICALAIKALVKFTLFARRRFVSQTRPRRLLANPLKFKRIRFQRLARVKFVNLILPKPPFQLGFVGTGRIGVVANHAVNVEDAPVAAAPERLCAFKHLVGIRAF